MSEVTPISEADEIHRRSELAAAGVDLYRAIQGRYQRCPMCRTDSLIHKIGCPVREYMERLGFGHAASIAPPTRR